MVMQVVNDILQWWYGGHGITECNGWWVSQYMALGMFIIMVILFSVSGSMNDERATKLLALILVSAFSVVAFTLLGPFMIVIVAVYFFSVLISPKD